MSVDTDLELIGPALAKAAALIAAALDLEAEPGEGFDLWGEGGTDLGEVTGKGSKGWSAPLVGPLGPCGEIALALASGMKVPGEGRVASGLAGSVAALSGACEADHLGEMKRTEPEALTGARPGQRAVAVLLSADGAPVGLVVVILSPSQPVAEFPHLDPSPGAHGGPRSIASLGDVEMSVSVELGRTKIPIKELLNIHNGAVVQLDRPVSQPVDIFVHGTLIARGEVVVVDEFFAVRVTELLTGD